jgi:DNA-binding CsgD family transcriptional regulator
MPEGLIDRIYEAGAIPELWEGVLDEAARIAGGLGAVLWIPNASRWVDTIGIRSMMAAFESSGLAYDNPRTNRLVAANHPGFLTDQDIFPLAEIPHEPIYRDFFIPRGGGFGAATVIPAPSGDVMILHVEKPYADGPVGLEAVAALDALRPHFARAGLLSARLELERARGAVAALERIGLAAAVLRSGGRVLAGNDRFHALVPSLFQDRNTRLTMAEAGADALLGAAIAGIGAGEAGVRSIPVAATEERPPAIVHVLPVRGAAHDIFTSAAALVIATLVVPGETPGAEVLQGLFDLTPAEARVARLIGNGETLAEIAAAGGRSEQTVRGQLKAILAKTGVRRQAELVGLLRGVPLPRGDGV